MTAQSFAIAFCLLMLALLALGCWIERRAKRKRLPAPEPRCVVGKDWKVHAQAGRFW